MTVPCVHFRDCGIVNGGLCVIGAYEYPSHRICLKLCEKYEGDPVERERLAAELRASIQAAPTEPRGWGTLIKHAIHAVLNWIDAWPRRSRYRLGFIVKVLECVGCDGRQRWFDRNFPYPPRWEWWPWYHAEQMET